MIIRLLSSLFIITSMLCQFSCTISGTKQTNIENSLRPLVVVKNMPRNDFSLKNRMAYHNVPGVSIAVISDGKISWTKGYGYADKEKETLVNENTIFEAASISKPIAAVGAMKLVDQGTITLDNNIFDYIESWKAPLNKFVDNQPITLKHLLSHSASLNDDPRSGYRIDEKLPTIIEILDGIEPSKTEAVQIDTIPGTVTKYSNFGYVILQLLMTDVTKKEFPAIYKELIFDPIGMSNSSYNQDNFGLMESQLANGYTPKGELISNEPLIYPEMAAAGLHTTPTDLAKFLISFGNSYNEISYELLDSNTAKDMTDIVIDRYGLGFKVEGVDANLALSHGGSNHGFRCYMVYYPTLETGAVIMTNSDSGMGLYYEILYSIAHEYNWPGYQSIEKTIEYLEPDDLLQFVGKYQMENGHVLNIAVDNDHLVLGTGSNDYLLYPESKTMFFDIIYGFTMDFISDEEGQVQEITMDRGGVITTLKCIG